MFLIRKVLTAVMIIIVLVGIGFSIYFANHDQIEKVIPYLITSNGLAGLFNILMGK